MNQLCMVWKQGFFFLVNPKTRIPLLWEKGIDESPSLDIEAGLLLVNLQSRIPLVGVRAKVNQLC